MGSESDMIPRFSVSETPGVTGDSMDIDGDPFHHSVRSSFYNFLLVNSLISYLSTVAPMYFFSQCFLQCLSYTLQDANPKILEADVELSRHRISVFLSTHTAYELLPESGKV